MTDKGIAFALCAAAYDRLIDGWYAYYEGDEMAWVVNPTHGPVCEFDRDEIVDFVALINAVRTT